MDSYDIFIDPYGAPVVKRAFRGYGGRVFEKYFKTVTGPNKHIAAMWDHPEYTWQDAPLPVLGNLLDKIVSWHRPLNGRTDLAIFDYVVYLNKGEFPKFSANKDGFPSLTKSDTPNYFDFEQYFENLVEDAERAKDKDPTISKFPFTNIEGNPGIMYLNGAEHFIVLDKFLEFNRGQIDKCSYGAYSAECAMDFICDKFDLQTSSIFKIKHMLTEGKPAPCITRDCPQTCVQKFGESWWQK